MHQPVQRSGARHLLHLGGCLFRVPLGSSSARLEEKDAAQHVDDAALKLGKVAPLAGHLADQAKTASNVALQDVPCYLQGHLVACKAQHVPDVRLGQGRAVGDDHLLEEVLGIAEAAGGVAGDQGEGLR